MHIVDATMFWGPESGGVRRYIRAKSRFIARQRGVQHTVVVPGPTLIDQVGVPSLPLPFAPGYRYPFGNRAAAMRVERLRPDLIEVGDPYQFAWIALRAARTLGIPTVGFYHSDITAMAARVFGMRAERIARGYVRYLYRRFDLVLAPSTAMAEKLSELGIERVVRQPLGVDTDTFCPQRRDSAWRRELGVSAKTHVLVYVGRYSLEKNLRVLTDAFGALGSEYLLVAIGNGPDKPCGTNVRVFPYQSNARTLARAIASSDALVHAGDQETFGLVALEALACGTPVISLAQAGLADLVDERVGIPVPTLSANAFADAIRSFAQLDREAHHALKTAARERALEFDWNRIFLQLLTRYRGLIQARIAQSDSSFETMRHVT